MISILVAAFIENKLRDVDWRRWLSLKIMATQTMGKIVACKSTPILAIMIVRISCVTGS